MELTTEIIDKASAKELCEMRDTLLNRVEELGKDRETIIYESTAQKLERNRVAMQAALGHNHEIGKALEALVAEPSARERELTEQIKKLIHEEKNVMANDYRITAGPTRGIVPERYIAADAVEKLQKEIAKLEAESKGILDRFNNSDRAMYVGDRTRGHLRQIDDEIRDLRDTLPLAEAGQKRWAIRQQQKDAEAERARLANERKRKVFAAA